MSGTTHRAFWNGLRDSLKAKGVIDVFFAKAATWSKPAMCIKLVSTAPLQQAQETPLSAARAGVLVSELPVDYQIFKFVEERGAEGFFQKDLRFPEVRRRHIEKLVERFVKCVVASPAHYFWDLMYLASWPAELECFLLRHRVSSARQERGF
jgi:hypothetical protein